jgi:hypothetical protein
MLARPQLLASALIVAAQAGAVHGASPAPDATIAWDGAAGWNPGPAHNLYRPATPVRSDEARRMFSLSTAVRAPVEPGTPSWLIPSASSAPLAASYDSPYAARKELGISYSSDGRLNAYVAGRDRGMLGGQAGRDVPPGREVDTPGRATDPDARQVASLLGQLKTRGLKLTLDDGWKVSAGARSRQYSHPDLRSRIGHVTLQRWWGDVSTAYSVQIEKRGGWNVAPSQSLQLGYAVAPRSTVALSFTAGQEIAFFAGQGMLKTEVRSLALQAEHAVKKQWSVGFEAGYYDHGELPAHKGVRVSFRRALW